MIGGALTIGCEYFLKLLLTENTSLHEILHNFLLLLLDFFKEDLYFDDLTPV